MEKFIQTSIGLKRIPPELIKHEPTGLIVGVQDEKLIITLEYIGYGDTIKITNEQLMDKLKILSEL